MSRFTGFCSVITACSGRPLFTVRRPGRVYNPDKTNASGPFARVPAVSGRLAWLGCGKNGPKNPPESRLSRRQHYATVNTHCSVPAYIPDAPKAVSKAMEVNVNEFFLVRFQTLNRFFDVSSQIPNLYVLTLLAILESCLSYSFYSFSHEFNVLKCISFELSTLYSLLVYNTSIKNTFYT